MSLSAVSRVFCRSAFRFQQINKLRNVHAVNKVSICNTQPFRRTSTCRCKFCSNFLSRVLCDSSYDITKITGLQESNSHNFTRKNSLTLSWIITSFEFSKNTEETWVFKTGDYRKRGSTICNALLFDFQFTQLKWSRMTHEHSLIPSGRSASPLSSTVWPERERLRRY